jgi:hypothetical protein
MLLSVLLYGGGALALAGLVAMLPRRTRRKGVWIFAIAMACLLIAIVWPAHEVHAIGVHSHIDELMPRWQFDERHELRIDAPPERIYAAIRDVTPREIKLFQTLTAIRRLGRRGEESILNAPDAKPILAVATHSGFRILVDDVPRELVLGTRIGPQTVAVMNFRIENDGRVTTETRVFARTDRARRNFAVYWRIIRPGSGIIRRSWLEAIKRRAEAKR